MRKINKLSDVPVWSQKIVTGEYPPAPCGPQSDGPRTWPLVEEKLKRGVGKRRVRYMLHDQSAGAALLFMPPEWWNVVSIQRTAESVDDRGEPTGQWVSVDPRPRKDGGAVIRRGWITVIEAEIDGPDMGIPEAVRYALTWQEMQPRSGRG